MRKLPQAILAIGLTAMGMAGLYFKIEYSGYVVFAGLLTAINV